MKIDRTLTVGTVGRMADQVFEAAIPKILSIQKIWDPAQGAPVFTRKGRYTSRGWTEWTQGFQFGCQLLTFEATGEQRLLDMGRTNTLRYMPVHVSHIGVHDHGFNNVSTYGALWRMGREGLVETSPEAMNGYELALKVSGAVQASRWSSIADGEGHRTRGYIHSFNGPHSLFSDTIRSCRALMLAHKLGHVLMGENDRRISLLGRALHHSMSTAAYNVYYGEGRDQYDVPGRVVHESIFNMTDGRYRCPSTQQGYSPFSTWTRGLAWVILGYAEFLESLDTLSEEDLTPCGGRELHERIMERALQVTADFYIANTASDGIPYWDTGAPGLANMPDWRDTPAQIENPHEPVDSSAAAIAAQGLLRLGHRLTARGDKRGRAYWQAGLTVAQALFQAPYLSMDTKHQGILLHSVYHRPNGWDYIPKGKSVPQGESSMWGDYHCLELALYLRRIASGKAYLQFDQAL